MTLRTGVRMEGPPLAGLGLRVCGSLLPHAVSSVGVSVTPKRDVRALGLILAATCVCTYAAHLLLGAFFPSWMPPAWVMATV